MVIPPINTSGNFTFADPFDKLTDPNQEYKVISVRALIELHNSNEEPCDSIYLAVGLTDTDFQEDLDANIPIVVFATTGGEYFYIPADRILSMPNVTGVKYRGVVLAIDLGLLPLDYDLTTAMSIIADDVKDAIGIESTVKLVPSTAITMMSSDSDLVFRRKLENSRIINKSYKTKYTELKELCDKKQQLLDELTLCIEKKCPSST